MRAQVYIHAHTHMCAHVKTAEEKGERKEARERVNKRKEEKLIIASVSCSDQHTPEIFMRLACPKRS